MNLKSKIAAAASRGNIGPGKKKKTPAQPMQKMPVNKATSITQNKGAATPLQMRPTAPVEKSKAEYKAENASAKLKNKYAKKAENREYRQEKTAAKREAKLDRIKSGEGSNFGEKVTKAGEAGATILTLIEGVKRAFPGKQG